MPRRDAKKREGPLCKWGGQERKGRRVLKREGAGCLHSNPPPPPHWNREGAPSCRGEERKARDPVGTGHLSKKEGRYSSLPIDGGKGLPLAFDPG